MGVKLYLSFHANRMENSGFSMVRIMLLITLGWLVGIMTHVWIWKRVNRYERD